MVGKKMFLQKNHTAANSFHVTYLKGFLGLYSIIIIRDKME